MYCHVILSLHGCTSQFCCLYMHVLARCTICTCVLLFIQIEVERLKRGKESLLGFLTGQVMKSSESQLKPQDVKSELVRILRLQSTENKK